MNCSDIISSLAQHFSLISTTPRLDAELLVAHACQQSRTYLYTYPQHALTSQQLEEIEHFKARHLAGEPIAYILQQQEFWSLEFKVTRATLIPRPETEHLVEWIITQLPADAVIRLADLGTGCGAIAIALASERPQWHIDATEQSSAALAVAEYNARQLQQAIHFYLGNWCQALPRHDYHVLVSNPPYIGVHDPHLRHLHYEPATALIAGEQGLDAIHLICQQAPQYLLPGGYLVLEHGWEQAPAIMTNLQSLGFINIHSHCDLAGLARFITAQWK